MSPAITWNLAVDVDPSRIAARQAAAAAYPTSMGTIAGTDKPLPCIPREAILRGDWDDGSLVRSFLAELERKER